MQRGRKSAASLALVRAFPAQLAAPPKELTPAQAEIWRATVATKPVDWFGADTYPLLASYCRAVVEHDWISAQIDAKKDEWLLSSEGLDLYDKATKLQERHYRVLANAATKMRLTQQSQYGPRKAAGEAGKARADRPWGAVLEHSPEASETAPG